MAGTGINGCPVDGWYGRPGGIRTPNPRIWSPMLYQLELLACEGKPLFQTLHASDGNRTPYFVSRWGVCLPQKRQYLLNSSLSGVVRLFLVVV